MPKTDSDDWSCGPDARFAPHAHPYEKTLTVRRGSIEFTLLPEGRTIRLEAGGRLALPPGKSHSAVAGPDGVSCHEDHVYP